MAFKKNKNLYALLSIVASAAVAYLVVKNQTRKNGQALPVVNNIDLKKYVGKWYEIARLPAPFQQGCFNTQAEYSLTKEGHLKVINTCNDGAVDGPLVSTEGIGIPVENSPGKIKVQFFWPFKGDYWILELGDNYEYSLVGEPDRKYLWILSRSPRLDDKIFDQLIHRATELGFPTNELLLTKHHV